MKQTLQLRLGQHLTMTPQLQQAIRLLQLSSLELQTEIQEALDANPLLEVDEEGEAGGETGTDTPLAEEAADAAEEPLPETTAEGASDIPEDLPVDSNWDDVYDSLAPVGSGSAPAGDMDDREFEYSSNPGGTSLHEHLTWQMDLTPFSPTDRAIAEFIIDAIGDDGFLTMSVEEIHEALAGEQEIEPEEIEAVLHRIQNFDPPGIAARDLRESLLLQLRQYPLDDPHLPRAITLVEEHFERLANRDYAQIMRRMKIDEDELKAILQLIQSLNPRPGSQITDEQPEYIIPDVIVTKVNGRWKVELNPEAAPRLRVNPTYASLARQVQNAEDNTYIKNQLQEARWFIKSLMSRNETLLKVATSIVERQIGFLEHGEEAMQALVLHDIAEAVDMHESTISRVTNKKYMHTPRGIFELKYFFSSHVSTADGGECSATAIRARIKKLIAAEDPKKPLSDSKLAAILAEEGINVARRTVAKYREAMHIPPSNERKRLA